MKSNPLVSVIMPMYNSEAFLASSIESVLSQTYGLWELLIIDDHSSDNSYEIAEAFAKQDERIRLYRMPSNSGAAAARNFAIEQSAGDYIAFLDSDDLWHPEKLQKQIHFMQTHDLAFSFCAFTPIDASGTEEKETNHVPLHLTYEGLLKQTVIGCLTVMYDQRHLGKCFFDTTLGKHEDYQCWLEILKRIPYAGGLNEPLAYYRIHGNSLSSNKLVAASYVWKIMHTYQHIPLPKALYYFSHYLFHAVIKHLKR